MSALAGEFVGTAILILLGDGVVANVVLKGTKGHGSGWIVITFGWAMAVFVGVLTVANSSGAHLNPAVSIGLAAAGVFDWQLVGPYILAQMFGACAGATLVWLVYKPHLDQTDDANAKLAVFCTAPAIRSASSNLTSEMIGTFVLVFAALNVSSKLGSLDALPIALVSWRSDCRWEGQRDMRLTRPEIWGLASCMLFCRSLASETAIGDTPGFPLPAPSQEPSSQRLFTDH